MKVSKDIGLVAAVLTLLHGLYLALYFLWVLLLIEIGLWRLAPPFLDPVILAVLDMVVYLFLGVGMLRGRQSYFIYAILWSIWGALLATFGTTYKNTVLNMLSFLIVFSCTYHHVNIRRTNADVAQKLGQFAGILAIFQGVIAVLVFTYSYPFYLRAFIKGIIPPLDGLVLGSAFAVVILVTMVVYFISGVGILKGKKEFFLLVIFWTIAESALAIADSSFKSTHFNVISLLILAFATYCYERK